MRTIEIIKYLFYFALLCLCAYTDYKKGKIYNIYLVLYILIFILTTILEYIIIYNFEITQITVFNEKIIDSFFGFIIGFTIGFILYLFSVFKGGDGKLIAIVGLCSGKKQIIFHYASIIIIAGIAALYVMLKNKILFNRLKNVFSYFRKMVLTLHYEKYAYDENDNIHFPFAVFILLGEVVSYINLYLRN